MQIDVPELAVVVLIGSRKEDNAQFAKKHFKSADFFSFKYPKAIVTYEEGKANEANEETLEAAVNDLCEAAVKSLKASKLTVIDTEGMHSKGRREIIRLAKKYHCFSAAIVLDSFSLAEEQKNKRQMDGDDNESIGSDTVYKTYKQETCEKDLVQKLKSEGFKSVWLLDSQEEIEKVNVQLNKLLNNKKDVHGPFDIIGDVHGCYDELCELLEKLGCDVERESCRAYPSADRKIVFVGDLVDRGPKIPEVLKLVMFMTKEETAYCVLGNHDGKLQRKLHGANVQVVHGLENSVEQLSKETTQFVEEVRAFLDGLVSHYVFDDGRLVVAHAGLKEKLHGRESASIRDLAMFGETTGKKDEYGLPIRLNWSADYSGKAAVIYGHTPRIKAYSLNKTFNIDTGCVFGGKLTALRYPENELVDVKAKKVYYEPSRPLID